MMCYDMACGGERIQVVRWNVDKCTHEDVKSNAERIYLEVFGQLLHHFDAPLFFAKMLYVQFVQGEDVDFSSKDVTYKEHTPC